MQEAIPDSLNPFMVISGLFFTSLQANTIQLALSGFTALILKSIGFFFVPLDAVGILGEHANAETQHEADFLFMLTSRGCNRSMQLGGTSVTLILL